jgi:hypothetical protein
LKDFNNNEEIIDHDLNPETKKVKEAVKILLKFLDEDETLEQAVKSAYLRAQETALRDSFYKNYHKWLEQLDGKDEANIKYYLIWDGYLDHPVEVATRIENLGRKRGKPYFEEPSRYELELWRDYSVHEFDDDYLSEMFFDEPPM